MFMFYKSAVMITIHWGHVICVDKASKNCPIVMKYDEALLKGYKTMAIISHQVRNLETMVISNNNGAHQTQTSIV